MKYLITNPRSNVINHRLILKVLGQLLMIEAAFMSLPLLVCWIYGEHDWTAFAIVIALTFSTGLAANFFSHPENRILKRRDGMLLASIAWIVF